MTQDHHDAKNKKTLKEIVDLINEFDATYRRSLKQVAHLKDQLHRLFNKSRALFSTDQEHLAWAKANFPDILRRAVVGNLLRRGGLNALQKALSSREDRPNRNMSPN